MLHTAGRSRPRGGHRADRHAVVGAGRRLGCVQRRATRRVAQYEPARIAVAAAAAADIPTDPKESGQVTFSDFGEQVTVSPPPADLVIDVSKLGG